MLEDVTALISSEIVSIAISNISRPHDGIGDSLGRSECTCEQTFHHTFSKKTFSLFWIAPCELSIHMITAAGNPNFKSTFHDCMHTFHDCMQYKGYEVS